MRDFFEKLPAHFRFANGLADAMEVLEMIGGVILTGFEGSVAFAKLKAAKEENALTFSVEQNLKVSSALSFNQI